MSNNVNRQWYLASHPVGMVQESDFELRESPVPQAGNGEVLVRNLYMSVDPAMRAWITGARTYVEGVQVGDLMPAGAIGQIVESNKEGFDKGDVVAGTFNWQDYIATDGKGLLPMRKVPAGIPLTMPLGPLGVTGITAYFGLLDVGKPVEGETVVVSAAAGATGSVVGQIAKLKGCHVVGIAGGPEKCGWVTDEAGFDAAIDYKSENVVERLKELCPKGIDVYFDNVGGPILEAALENIAMNARGVICGAISTYNAKEPPPGPRNYLRLLMTRSRMEGFIVLDYFDRVAEAANELAGWLMAGKIKYREDIVDGLENAPKALLRLFESKNFGKQLVKIADPPIGQ